jgi:hypothetical protein
LVGSTAITELDLPQADPASLAGRRSGPGSTTPLSTRLRIQCCSAWD